MPRSGLRLTHMSTGMGERDHDTAIAAPTDVGRAGGTSLCKGRVLLRNAWRDLRYGRLLAPIYWRDPAQANSDYGALERMRFDPISPDDVLVDLGCGGGRVINHWLSLGLQNQLIGIELDLHLAFRTANRLRRHRNVSIRTGDAIANLPEEGTVFYLFNPFGRDKVAELEATLRATASRRPRCRVIYHNPKHLDVFEVDDHWSIEHDRDLGRAAGEEYHTVAYIERAA